MLLNTQSAGTNRTVKNGRTTWLPTEFQQPEEIPEAGINNVATKKEQNERLQRRNSRGEKKLITTKL